MDQQTVEVSDFQFRALRRVRLFPPGTFQATGTTVPRWLATSSGLGLTVVATPSGELISFNTADVHNLLPGRTNLSVEVTDLPKKITPFRLSRQSAAASISLIDGSSDGKTLAIVATKPSTGDPFVFLYDFRLFSLQYTGEVYPYLEIRLSSSGGATATDLQWNPAIGNMFCASCSDGTLTTFTIDETDATKYSVVGTLRITDGSPLCISWSPKGKQLVVGLDNGIMKQLKPELAPVRQVPAPAGSVVRLPNDDVRCAGLCWLTTTEFAVAYAQKNTQAVVLTLLTVKKDGAPVW
uniref:Nucleoporin Nup159/Nup146 N-terminal domain-containing protein n=1 Tax=Plectus sambesii TaxID=2011161 RepID=A0A914UQH2_9BILA